MTAPAAARIRPMTRPELDVLVDWAAAEGWNPGLRDADAFWAADPAGFVAAEVDGRLAGGGSIVAYGQAFGFMGFFIVRPELRGAGLGARLWTARRDALLARLDPGAPIGMDGVVAMQPFYARGGFALAHRDARLAFTGRAAGGPGAGLAAAASVPLEALEAYDARHFPAPRPAFLRRWLAPPEGTALAALEGGRVVGMGVRRRCRAGHKVGPLFADRPEIAEALLASLADEVRGEAMALDLPAVNPAGPALAARWGMRQVFECGRMYLGAPPALPADRIFGVTTFELG